MIKISVKILSAVLICPGLAAPVGTTPGAVVHPSSPPRYTATPVVDGSQGSEAKSQQRPVSLAFDADELQRYDEIMLTPEFVQKKSFQPSNSSSSNKIGRTLFGEFQKEAPRLFGEFQTEGRELVEKAIGQSRAGSKIRRFRKAAQANKIAAKKFELPEQLRNPEKQD